ncbi:cytochrome P460 family protein [Burkholderia seminalis]|uniref:cytochrome P460 family protein n=1 Tax=Burkholderia seminalis TaxID=488731 RepID=UPI001CF18F5D|nr:cytochrome P460 family protein [Burkholderia seminalis]MCA8423048.1 cytochrome P460 family protein [Burkholderia seminalis]MDN7849152.1 cytochrome P460 family protein [Burkholderia seminalis]
MRARVRVWRRGARRALVAGVLLGGALSAGGSAAFAEQPKPAAAASPIYGVTIPPGYRKWEMVAPAEEAAPLDELRVVLGNPVAIRALEQATLPFPDGTILVKLAYKRRQSDEFAPATVPGQATTVQVMVKDARRYASTGGWGFGRFVNGVPADIGQHQTCFACHQARVKNHDYVFTRLAP